MTEKNRGKRLVTYVKDYVVFDLETTGVNAAEDEIIEISGIKVKDGEVADTFSTLVNPGRRIPAQATAVNGITDEMVKDAPRIGPALSDFLEFAGKEVLVGHNIHTFDLNFICNGAAKHLGRIVDNDYIDTLFMARSCLPQLRHHKLVDVAAHFQISQEGAHRALNDCMMNQQCFEALAKLQETMPLNLCPKCGGELVERSGKFGRFWGCSNFPDCRYTKNIRG